MLEREPMTRTLNVTDARQQFSQLLNQVFRRQTRVIVEKSGIPVAAIISAGDLAELERFRRDRAERSRALDETRDAFKDLPDEELEREVAKAVAEARRKHRAARQRGELTA